MTSDLRTGSHGILTYFHLYAIILSKEVQNGAHNMIENLYLYNRKSLAQIEEMQIKISVTLNSPYNLILLLFSLVNLLLLRESNALAHGLEAGSVSIIFLRVGIEAWAFIGL